MATITPDRLPNTEAIAHFNGKVLLTTQHYAELKAYEHALAFTVAKIADKDMLTEVHKAMKQAMANGTSFSDFKKQLKPYLLAKGWLGLTNSKDDQKYLAHRLRTIYHTNKATAYAGGQWERIQRTKEILPYLQYMPSVSTNKRDEHKKYYGLVRPVDDPIWQSIFPPNGFGCKCWVKQLTKTRAEKILNEQAEKGKVYDIEMEEIKHPLTGEMMTVPKGVHFSFNHNHDRLTALLKLAQDKHGAEFAQKLGVDLKGEMVGYAVKGGITHIDFRGITPRVGEVARLEKELNGNVSPFEGVVADEWQQKFEVTLERFDPNIHKVLAYNTKTNTPKSADYAIVDLAQDPKNWVILDLMFTVSQAEADIMANMALKRISNKNPKKQAKIDGFWDSLKETIDDHLQKADIVPMDLRKLDPELVVKIIGYVLSLPVEQQKQVVLITG